MVVEAKRSNWGDTCDFGLSAVGRMDWGALVKPVLEFSFAVLVLVGSAVWFL